MCLQALAQCAVKSAFMYDETGRYYLYGNCAIRCIQYWLIITQLDIFRLSKQAYIMIYKTDENDQSCWASMFRNTLFKHGFRYESLA